MGWHGHLALDYQGKNVRWTLDLIQQEDDTDEFRPQISLLANTTAIPAPPDARTNWYPGTRLRQKDSTVATRAGGVQGRMNSSWSSPSRL